MYIKEWNLAAVPAAVFYSALVADAAWQCFIMCEQESWVFELHTTNQSTSG